MSTSSERPLGAPIQSYQAGDRSRAKQASKGDGCHGYPSQCSNKLRASGTSRLKASEPGLGAKCHE
jgi:hypothetical protein